LPTRQIPPIDFLNECFDYNAATGSLTWKERPLNHFPKVASQRHFNKRYSGHEAGCKDPNGHVVLAITYNGSKKIYFAHRVIWKIVTGENPPPIIDHRDNNQSNNAWANLRAATMAQNSQNQHRRRGKELPKGVFRKRNTDRFYAQIMANKKLLHLGTFASPEEAHEAYCRAARMAHGEFWRPI